MNEDSHLEQEYEDRNSYSFEYVGGYWFPEEEEPEPQEFLIYETCVRVYHVQSYCNEYDDVLDDFFEGAAVLIDDYYQPLSNATYRVERAEY